MAARRNKYADQVAALSAAKFTPQLQALKLLLSQAGQDRQQGIDVARSTGRAVAGLARTAVPQADASLTATLTGLSQAKGQMPSVQDTSGPAGAIAAGSQRDMTLAASNAQAQAQRTRDELIARQTDAASGAAQGVLQAQATYRRDRERIGQQLSDLSAQEGAFSAGELAKLLSAETSRNHSIAQQQRSQAFSREQQQRSFDHTDANRTAKTAPLVPGGVKRRTPLQEGAAKDSVGQALTYAQQLKAGGRTMQEAGSTLKKGRETQTVEVGVEKDPATGRPRNKTVKVPGIPRQKTLWSQVAVQTAYWGGITRNTARELHRRGYSYRALGLKIVEKPGTGAASAPR